MVPIHKQLTAGRWQRLSLMEQLANVGSEVGRAARWYGKDQQRRPRPLLLSLWPWQRELDADEWTMGNARGKINLQTDLKMSCSSHD
jgi:hypothetical protein